MSHDGRIQLVLVALVALLAAVLAMAAGATAVAAGGAFPSTSPTFNSIRALAVQPSPGGPYPAPVDEPVVLADTALLTFEAELPVRYPVAACPAGSSSTLECFVRRGSGIIRGLGKVEEAYPYLVEDSPAGCDENQVRVLPTTGHLSVPGKGELEFRLDGTGCLNRVPPLPLHAEETLLVTTGSGSYAGASGGGTIAHLSYGPPSLRGKDTWRGTIAVPGLDFDLTPPVLTAPGRKTVLAPRRLKRVRVTYVVTAQDNADGALPVTCRPSSGSWFSIGRTRVRCSATDTSGNESAIIFVVAVKRQGRERRSLQAHEKRAASAALLR